MLYLGLLIAMLAYRHVGLAACIHGLGYRIDQVSADAKVTHLDLALCVDQHVGGLDVCTGDMSARLPQGLR